MLAVLSDMPPVRMMRHPLASIAYSLVNCRLLPGCQDERCNTPPACLKKTLKRCYTVPTQQAVQHPLKAVQAQVHFDCSESDDDAHVVALPRRHTDPLPGCVYVVKNAHMPFVKIGRWSGSLGALQARYHTVYGRDTSFYTLSVSDTKKTEKILQRHFRHHNINGELFAVDDGKSVMWYVSEVTKIVRQEEEAI